MTSTLARRAPGGLLSGSSFAHLELKQCISQNCRQARVVPSAIFSSH
jgi:hypothetical protein